MRVLPRRLPVVSAVRAALTVGLATLGWIGGTAHAQIGPGVPCPNAGSPLVDFICSNPDLSQLDIWFVQPYQKLRAQLDYPGAQKKLLREADAFNLARQHCLSRRNVVLAMGLSSAAAEERARPLHARRAVQADLKRLGFLPPDAAVDGVFGPVTRKAIQQWQKSRRIHPTDFLDDYDRALLEQQAASLHAPSTATASSPVSPSEQDERQRAAENARRRLQEQTAEDQLNSRLKELGFQRVSPVDLNLDWRAFMTNNTKVAVRGTYFHAHDVEMLSTPDNRDLPTIRLYTNDASREARRLMLECRNSNFKYSLCEMIVGATIKKCIRNKGELNEKEIPCLNVQEAYRVP